jgi:hypothetical protein
MQEKASSTRRYRPMPAHRRILPNRNFRPVSGLTRIDVLHLPMAFGHSGVSKDITRIPLRGQHRTCSKRAYRFPVSPHARRHGAPETGRHLNIRGVVRQFCEEIFEQLERLMRAERICQQWSVFAWPGRVAPVSPWRRALSFPQTFDGICACP